LFTSSSSERKRPSQRPINCQRNLPGESFEEAVAKNDVRFEARRESSGEFMALIDTFSLWFNIVTPYPVSHENGMA
jgi:hypothetical protein